MHSYSCLPPEATPCRVPSRRTFSETDLSKDGVFAVSAAVTTMKAKLLKSYSHLFLFVTLTSHGAECSDKITLNKLKFCFPFAVDSNQFTVQCKPVNWD